MRTDIDVLLRTLMIRKASDLHFQAGTRPVFRIDGELFFSDMEPMSANEVEEYAYSILSEEQKERFNKNNYIDFSYEVQSVARFRVNIYRQRGNVGIAARLIPFEIPTIEELGLPSVVRDLATKPNGLVLFTGPCGCGKTTSLAAITEYINTNFKKHIITIEDPVEFVHHNVSSMINQREVGSDTESFGMALKNALREDPNIILVGEMRDLDTISNAITAAETGHLVFATLHTSDAAQTIDRMIDVFPAHQQVQIRIQLGAVLKGVVVQSLLRKVDGSGRVAAFEVLVMDAGAANLIKEGRTNQIYSFIQTGRQLGMQTFESSLVDLCKKGI
ncbi:MAG: type IV pilus twitching motility protein PilT, partial [Gammaproteobacteria bacterium]|nr:type IV pilus twitching motility protein PilT [Gammaproteobacteria bacterium]